MRGLVWILWLLLTGPLWPASGLAQDIDVFIYSDLDGGGALVGSGFDFSAPNPIFQNFCIQGTCLFATTDPGFRTPDVDSPGDSLFAVQTGTPVRLEIVAIHDAVSVKVGSTILDAVGESASLGVANGVHLHPEFQVVIPAGETGQFPFSFKLTGAGYGESPAYELVLSNEPTPTPGPTATPTPIPTPSPTLTAEVDAYLLYKAKPSKLDLDPTNHKFPKDYNLNLDDTMLPNDPADEHPDDPENYTVKHASGLGNPASLDAGPVVASDLHYLRYALKESKEGTGAPDERGRFPKATKAPSRRVEVENRFGTLFVETGGAAALLLPAGASESAVPAGIGDHIHYLCYSARSSKLPSEQAPEVKATNKGRFRKDLQAFARDMFADCALEPGGGASFPGTSVEGACLVDMKKPSLLCMPASKSAVEPPRLTSAVIDTSDASNAEEALLCYGVKLARKVRNAETAVLGELAVDERLEKFTHQARTAKEGTAVRTTPSNGFPAPAAIDTKTLDSLCLPTDILSVSIVE